MKISDFVIYLNKQLQCDIFTQLSGNSNGIIGYSGSRVGDLKFGNTKYQIIAQHEDYIQAETNANILYSKLESIENFTFVGDSIIYHIFFKELEPNYIGHYDGYFRFGFNIEIDIEKYK